jgi:hypothetical protein
VKRDFNAIAKRIQAEEPIPLTRAAKLVKASRGRRGHVSLSTLIKWATRGKRGVYLDAVKLAGEGWWTSEPAIARFAAELTEKELGRQEDAEQAVVGESDAERRDRERRADAAIEEQKRLRDLARQRVRANRPMTGA